MSDTQKTNACLGGTSCPTYPCQTCWSPPICQQSSATPKSCPRNNDSFGSMFIDVIGVSIFFIFMVLQVWFKVANYVLKGCKAFYCADRVVQIALSIVGLLILSSFSIHVFLGARCYKREQQLIKSKAELKQKGSTAVDKAAAAKKKLEEIIKPLVITLQYPKQFKTVPLNVTRVFTVRILDQTKKKIYESQQEVRIPEKERPPLVMAMKPIVISNYQ